MLFFRTITIYCCSDGQWYPHLGNWQLRCNIILSAQQPLSNIVAGQKGTCKYTAVVCGIGLLTYGGKETFETCTATWVLYFNIKRRTWKAQSRVNCKVACPTAPMWSLVMQLTLIIILTLLKIGIALCHKTLPWLSHQVRLHLWLVYFTMSTPKPKHSLYWWVSIFTKYRELLSINKCTGLYCVAFENDKHLCLGHLARLIIANSHFVGILTLTKSPGQPRNNYCPDHLRDSVGC